MMGDDQNVGPSIDAIDKINGELDWCNHFMMKSLNYIEAYPNTPPP